LKSLRRVNDDAAKLFGVRSFFFSREEMGVMGRDYLMALDVGGGSGRCLLLDPRTGAIHSSKRDWVHPAAPEAPGLGFNLDTDDIWAKLGEACSDALAKAGAGPGDVVGIAVTSMRNTTVIIDGEGKVLFATPNQDARAVGEALVWAGQEGKAVHEIGGHWPSPLFTGSRLLWLKANSPGVLDSASAVLSLSDWVAHRLGARVVAERSQSGETLLFDQRKRDWAGDLIASLGFKVEIFPETVDAGTVIGSLSREAAAHLGLQEGVPIAACGADTQCGLLGAGATEPGDACVIAGTTMPVQLVTSELVLDAEGRLWTGQHVIPGLYVLESNGLTTGAVLDWLARIIYAEHDDPVLVLFGEAELSEPGAAGVYSTFGACTFDARKINIPVGNLTMSHMVTPGSGEGRRHVSRSLIEGIAFSARANLDQVLGVAGLDTPEIKACAGMTASRLWTQILSDVTARKVTVPPTTEASALGAAICAGVGAGVFGDLAGGAREVVKAAREHTPGDDAGRYEQLYAGWSQACSMRAPADEHVSVLVTMAMLGREAPAAAVRGDFRPRLLVTASMDQAALEELRELGEVDYSGWREANRIYMGGDELARALDGYDVFVTEMDMVDFEAIRALPSLRVIAACRVNPVNVDIESATAFGVPVFNTPGRNADAVADLAVTFMVMLARKLPAATRFLEKPGGAAGDLARMGEAYVTFRGNELWRKAVGIVGLGSVGRAVARRVKAAGGRAVFYDPGVSAAQGALYDARKVSLEALLAASDFVTLHAPALEETERLMGPGEFAAMKEGAFFVNTARASLVDETALLKALDSGHLAGAALDVFAVEPPASDDPLVTNGKVIVTPHVGGDTFETGAHQGAIVARQLRQLMSGAVPGHILNPEVMDAFTWEGQRREPVPEEIERLSKKPKPSITS
jgi:sugar (pentulose or hexulose) kinase/phosphoglycerate dehydrogenase-like enzyme